MRISEVREQIDTFYGPPLQVISDCLRGFLVAEPGKKFIACDFSAIEARMIAWLAGEELVLEIFRTHGKVYEHSAAGIFRVEMDAIDNDDPRRQIGKVSILSLGYQGGVGALQNMAKNYGVKFAPAFEGLWSAANDEMREKAAKGYQSRNRATLGHLSKEEYMASELVKLAWRASNPAIVQFWYDLEEAAANAVAHPGEKFTAGAEGRKIIFIQKGSFLLCRLPSSRCLVYPYPKLEQAKTPWGQVKQIVTFMAEESLSRKWIRHKTYGGFFAENITQATSRDILAEAMLRLDERGFDIVLHIHDEIVVEVLKTLACEKEVREIVCMNPEWSKGLPLAAGSWVGERYRK